MTNGGLGNDLTLPHMAELKRQLDNGMITEMEFHEYKCESMIAEALHEFYKSTGCVPLVYFKAYGSKPESGCGVSVKALY